MTNSDLVRYWADESYRDSSENDKAIYKLIGMRSALSLLGFSDDSKYVDCLINKALTSVK